MLLVLYREYVKRCTGISDVWTYKEWLDRLDGDATYMGISRAVLIRSEIDPVYGSVMAHMPLPLCN